MMALMIVTEFERLPSDGNLHELDDGDLVAMPLPQTTLRPDCSGRSASISPPERALYGFWISRFGHRQRVPEARHIPNVSRWRCDRCT
jgi:hypothetical protein